MNSKYLTSEQIKRIIGDLTVDETFVPMSQDTYNETAVLISITDTKKVPDLLMAAINMACVGYGNKKFGNFKYQDKLWDITDLLKGAGVKVGLAKDAKLNEKDLTPQRLCRAFRNEIRKYIIDKKFETYLYRKYSTHLPEHAKICFRGAEYLDDLTKEECEYLLLVYKKLDEDKNTHISDRIKRVFQAKGFMPRVFEPP